MGHEQFEEAVALYAIEALEPQERAALESHVASGCQECRAALAEYQEVAALLPYGLRSQPVPHQVKVPSHAGIPPGFSRHGVRP